MELHKRLEARYNQPAGSLKTPLQSLLDLGQSEAEILDTAEGCAVYCLKNKVNFVVAFHMYASIVKQKKK